MRSILILFAAFLIIGSAMGSAMAANPWSYLGPEQGFLSRGTITAEEGFGGSYVPSDVSGTKNPIGQVVIQTIAAAESSDDDQLINTTAGALNQTTNLLITSTSGWFLAQPDVPRNIIATWNASTSGSVKLTGTDIAGSSITENLSVSSGTTAASTKAFKTVTRIDADLTTGQTAKTLKIGTGDLLGLNVKLSYNSVLFDYVGSTRDTTAPSVTVNSSVLSLNTIDTNTAPGGAVTKVWMVV